MKIVSKFHDYYDGALKLFNNDPLPIYDRTISVLYIDDRNWNEKIEADDFSKEELFEIFRIDLLKNMYESK